MLTRAGIRLITAILIAAAMGPVTRAGAQENTSALIGTPTINFSLASTQDRLITYGQEYYGRHNLVITFFPAAFTPV
ncbi:MAG: hypothetical protein EG822_02670 [Deltaproteobacteria bacterium]|nr:hypothetical protein [Deltaproteobacteria bacterium]TLN02015.1 MAG: hypothetical protein FDZ73_13655 [bacterium]